MQGLRFRIEASCKGEWRSARSPRLPHRYAEGAKEDAGGSQGGRRRDYRSVSRIRASIHARNAGSVVNRSDFTAATASSSRMGRRSSG